jgi:hypothetical protein
MRRIMMDYNHWSAFGLLGEILPWPDNRVTLAKETDQFGLRVAQVNFDLHDNDEKLIEFGKNKVEQVMRTGSRRAPIGWRSRRDGPNISVSTISLIQSQCRLE